ncbi:hypothetical protein NEPAR06_2049 [Nematocida parisii]|uniref:Uncharacterized protein n=1 Tax=Nematocida parisii (strain ERTm3) TaxID=935791 RepID=I3EDV2_NEMP3|nr:uncharacterized protein NEPG_00002 [Nematocida parisii ERTm1]EIJ87399.1 hypothetical protein NEQG_02280 [Nematocida parisii ERTm3]KAI5145392.1 hypothetical protein NEPAR07_1652 [Nematocida parisii]EIJ94480.1 hypothetical protein NEPG_00002 [Nematocida parisii ERTm1]KAI5155777.1 hypothetical protein NEPAR06_2049 [Nematocida parisii]KAI5157000.1 hypothetical protein NEPAR05_0955 [Nematocida parisii]|eukprot:XP_013057836.1 hypothetical protein NEPG_00002 [Nematocida parisii ERTm1]
MRRHEIKSGKRTVHRLFLFNYKTAWIFMSVFLCIARAELTWNAVNNIENMNIDNPKLGKLVINPYSSIGPTKQHLQDLLEYMFRLRMLSMRVKTKFSVSAKQVDKTAIFEYKDRKYDEDIANQNVRECSDYTQKEENLWDKAYLLKFYKVLLKMFHSMDGVLSIKTEKSDSFYNFITKKLSKEDAHTLLASLLLLSEGVNTLESIEKFKKILEKPSKGPIASGPKNSTQDTTTGTSKQNYEGENMPRGASTAINAEEDESNNITAIDEDFGKKEPLIVLDFFIYAQDLSHFALVDIKKMTIGEKYNTGMFLETPSFLIQSYIYKYICKVEDMEYFIQILHDLLWERSSHKKDTTPTKDQVDALSIFNSYFVSLESPEYSEIAKVKEAFTSIQNNLDLEKEKKETVKQNDTSSKSIDTNDEANNQNKEAEKQNGEPKEPSAETLRNLIKFKNINQSIECLDKNSYLFHMFKGYEKFLLFSFSDIEMEMELYKKKTSIDNPENSIELTRIILDPRLKSYRYLMNVFVFLLVHSLELNLRKESGVVWMMKNILGSMHLHPEKLNIDFFCILVIIEKKLEYFKGIIEFENNMCIEYYIKPSVIHWLILYFIQRNATCPLTSILSTILTIKKDKSAVYTLDDILTTDSWNLNYAILDQLTKSDDKFEYIDRIIRYMRLTNTFAYRGHATFSDINNMNLVIIMLACNHDEKKFGSIIKKCYKEIFVQKGIKFNLVKWNKHGYSCKPAIDYLKRNEKDIFNQKEDPKDCNKHECILVIYGESPKNDEDRIKWNEQCEDSENSENSKDSENSENSEQSENSENSEQSEDSKNSENSKDSENSENSKNSEQSENSEENKEIKEIRSNPELLKKVVFNHFHDIE